MKFVLRLLLNAAALYGIAHLNLGLHIADITWAIIGALILGIANAIVRPILIILTLPLTILTLGLFTFVVNAVVFWLVAYLTPGFRVDNFGSAFVCSLIMWVVSWVVNQLLADASPAAT
ncbi:MAG TPA: phage holin family protein [Candidatus Baltobacteraceae bacterium]